VSEHDARDEVLDDEPVRAEDAGPDVEEPSPGRGPRGFGDGRWWRLGVTGAAVAALVWGSTVVDGGVRLDGAAPDQAAAEPSPGAGGASFVDAASLGCPGPELLGVDGEEATQTVTVAAQQAMTQVLDRMATEGVAVPSSDDGDGAGDDLALTATGEGPRSASARADGSASLEVDEPRSGLVLAQGSSAPGAVGGQLGLDTGPGARGLSLTSCTTPAETQWLVGGGDAPGRSEQLVLTNPGEDAVTVEVTVWGEDGPVPATGATGIVVPGRGRTVELLDALAPSASSPVVRVRATGGTVVAHLGEHFREGTTDRGAEVAGAAAEPALDLVVPALPTPDDEREHEVVLRLVAPGDEEAVVQLTALTEDGARRLAGAVTRVAAGHTVDVVLEDLPAGTTALRLRSDQPVTAGARLEVLPGDEEPTVGAQDDAAVTTGPDGDGASGDEAGGDESAATTGPDEDASDQDEPLVRPAGDLAWVAGTTLATSPIGSALPGAGDVPGLRRELAVSAVDGTDAVVVWLDEEGRASVERLSLRNDTTAVVPVPDGARAVWVVSTGLAGVAASVLVQGADEGGPYAAATTLPRVPWQRQVTQVDVVLP
jgi:hypothetical protein